jgi:hypothetical protein
MAYQLVPASIGDQPWLERLRREVYQELFIASFGGWDEARHARQFGECLNRGGISIIEVDGVRVGMIQFFDQPDAVELGEIQIEPSHQNQRHWQPSFERYDCSNPRATQEDGTFCRSE